MMKWLDRLFRPPSPTKREKPEEILYGIDERPGAYVLFSVGIQHVLLSLMFSIYAVLVGSGIGLDHAETTRFVGSTLFIIGLGTVLQAVRSRFTPGLLFVGIPSPISMAVYTAVVVEYGLGAAMGAILLSHIVIISLARFLPRMRPLFPPEVIGVVVLMLGVSLVAGGMGRSTGLIASAGVSAGAILAALATIVCIVVFSVWGSRQLRTIAVLIGMAVGVVVAFMTGVTSMAAFSGVADLPLIAVPFLSTPLPIPQFVPAAIFAIFLVELFGAMDQFGCGLTMDKLNDANWRRADMLLVSRTVITFSLTNVLHGLTGTMTSATSSANIGLAHSSGVMARNVGLVAGAILCLIGFVPAVPALIVYTPAPVVGAILVYTASFMIVAGMDLILSRLLNMKRTFTVGLSIVVGLAVMLLPELVEEAPTWSRTIFESGLTTAALAAILLNAIFRIGVKRRSETALAGPDPGHAAAVFLEHNGKIWGARKDVIMRAGIAVGEALEAIEDAGVVKGPVTLSASFDEFDLACRLSYPGKPLALNDHEPVDAKAMLDEEDDGALDAAMMRMSSMLVARLADRVRSTERNGIAELRLHFNH